MSKPIEFASSAQHHGVQIADLIAGVATIAPDTEEHPEIQELAEMIWPHLQDSILPDFGVLDLDADEAQVNWIVLEELAYRADIGADPLLGMAEFYDLLAEACRTSGRSAIARSPKRVLLGSARRPLML